MIGWRPPELAAATSLLLLRHGVTDATLAQLFSGSGGADPGLNDLGREQADRAARWLAEHGGVDEIVSSPLRRTRETAAVVAEHLGLPVSIEDGLAEAAFGEWDGLTFDEVRQRWPDELEEWLGSVDAAPPGGESYTAVSRRVLAAKARLLIAQPQRRLLLVTHVTPIKLLVRDALDAPLHVIHRIQVAPASVSTIVWWADGVSALQQLSYLPQ
jgi:probable phosphoglycerate mutase